MAWRTTIAKHGQVAGFKKGAEWGTAVAVGAGSGLPFKNISGLQSTQDVFEVQEIDLPIRQCAFLGVNKPIDLTITSDMSYGPGALGALIAMVFGAAGEPTGETIKLHKFKLTSDPGLFGTLAIGMPGEIWEIPSVKPYSWTLKMGGEGLIESEIKAIGDRLVAPAVTNDETSMGAITYDERCNHCFSKEYEFFINGQDGADFQETDKLDINNFEVSVLRTLGQAPPSIGSGLISQPVDSAPAVADLKIGFPKYGSDISALIADQVAGTKQKAKLVLTGKIATGTDPYRITVYFPCLIIKPVAAKYDDIISADIEFLGLAVGTAPNGMSEGVPYMTIENLRTTDYLG